MDKGHMIDIKQNIL